MDTRTYQPGNVAPNDRGTGASECSITSETGERRIVTILFIDVVGSTAMAENLDPEEWAELMGAAFERMIRPIERYGGTVTRLMGDAILALFGAPHARGDDAQRAILAALEIMDDVQPLRAEIKRRGLEFDLRAGINTGLVVVGEFGTRAMVEYTAMGDAINVASRLEQMAAPGTIRVGASTYRLTEPYFEFEPLGEVDVRGKRAPESSYRVLGHKRGARRPEHSQRTMPFIGREAELAQVREAIDTLRSEGRGRIIAISGEPGVGKSRLVDEIVDYVRSRPPGDGGLSVALLENRIHPIDGARAYAGLQARFRSVFGIDVNDSSEVVRQKFVARTSQFPDEFRERAAQVIQRVMALDFDGMDGDIDALAPEEFRAELATVVLQVVRGWNPDGAFMLVGEDYHWSDAASLEIAGEIFSLLHEQPVLFLFTYRQVADRPVMRIVEEICAHYPDFLMQIDLAPLPSDAARRLVEQLIEGEADAARRLRGQILERAEGNPLFIEELILALADQGLLEPVEDAAGRWRPGPDADPARVSLPDSIQGLLLERIDRLPPGARRTLQQAAVLGRTFNRRVLQRVAQVNGELAEHLEALLCLDMLRALDDGDELTFRHAMIQEMAYNTILLRHRRHFHGRAAAALEHIFADRVSEYTGDIAMHYFRAEDARGVDWLLRAAEQAQAVHQPELVADYAGKALQLTNRLDAPLPGRALLMRGHARDVLGDFDGARADLEALADLANELGDLELKWGAHLELGAIWAVKDYHRAGAHVRDALATAHLIGDESKVAHSLNRMGNWHVNVGKPGNALRAHEQARAIFQRLGDSTGIAETLDLVGLAYYLTGDFGRSDATYRESIAMFRESGNRRGLSSSLAMLALTGAAVDTETVPRAAGPLDERFAAARESIEIARSISWRAGESFALLVFGELVLAYGHAGQGLAQVFEALERARAIAHEQWTIAATAALGGIAMDTCNWERACEYVTDTLERARELGSAYWTAVGVSRLVDWYLAHGDLEGAASLLDAHIGPRPRLDYIGQRKLWYRRGNLALARGNAHEALEIADLLLESAPGMTPGMVIPRLGLLRGMALLALGQETDALEELRAVVAESVATGDWLREFQSRAALARAHEALGESSQAALERQRASQIRERVTAQLPDGEWRAAWTAGAERIFAE
ncbi:MAG TPA: adenylate/guanylate cyclase domain-containing protein [Thermomicrobiales bacterium]|nr:adenylate/guanylate cyclase domain-containing protein [Thermomicrobiales bacterium]